MAAKAEAGHLHRWVLATRPAQPPVHQPDRWRWVRDGGDRRAARDELLVLPGASAVEGQRRRANRPRLRRGRLPGATTAGSCGSCARLRELGQWHIIVVVVIAEIENLVVVPRAGLAACGAGFGSSERRRAGCGCG